MEKLFDEGVLRSIGVSNYNIPHLEHLLSEASISPAVNQCEYHPHYYTPGLVEYCQQHNIHFQAYSSFGSESNKAEVLNDSTIKEMALKYGTSVPRFLLAWSMSQGMSVLPRSRNPQHVRENFGASQLTISKEDIEASKSVELRKYCWDPSNVA